MKPAPTYQSAGPRRRGAVVVRLAVVLVSSCSTGPAASSPEVAADLLAAADRARAAAEVPVLEHSGCAADQALERARALVGSDELTHADLTPVIRDCGTVGAGENLVRSARPADEVVAAWLASPGHRENLLGTDYVAEGMACAPDGEEQVCSHVFLMEQASDG